MARAYRHYIHPKLREEVIEAKGRLCTYCGTGPLYKKRLHLDHLIPCSAGGANTIENLFPCCPKCNSAKRAQHIVEYVSRRIPKVEQELAMLKNLQALYVKK